MPSYQQSQDSKLWSVRFREMDGAVEKHKRLSGFRTKKEAQAAYIQYIQDKKDREEAVAATGGLLLFTELLQGYYKQQEHRVKESSFFDMQMKINSRILPFFQDYKIAEITPAVIMEWQQTVSGYSYEYRQKLMTYIRSIFKYGYRYYGIPNPCDRVENFRSTEPKKEMNFWTPDEFSRFISVVDDPTYHLFFLTIYLTGCRKGEVSALGWEDIDLEGKSITIRKNLTNKTKGNIWTITTPKTESSYREITIPQSLCDKLAAVEDKIKPFVFGGDRPLPPQSTLNKFRQYTRIAGVKPIRIHDLRHSHASLLISSGISIVAVSRRLGHKSVKETLDTYAHMFPDDLSQINSVIKNVSDFIDKTDRSK